MSLKSILVLVAAILWGIWCGEDLTVFLGVSVIGVLGAMTLVAVALRLFRQALGRGLLLLGVVVALFVGIILGANSASSAFNECVNRGERVRQELENFHAVHRIYPEKLSDIQARLPGERWLRANIMEYKKTETGYDLQFRDFLITHMANERSGFTAYK